MLWLSMYKIAQSGSSREYLVLIRIRENDAIAQLNARVAFQERSYSSEYIDSRVKHCSVDIYKTVVLVLSC